MKQGVEVGEKRNMKPSPKSRLLPEAFYPPLAQTSMFANSIKFAYWSVGW